MRRFGGKQTVGLGILGTAIFTLLTPLAARAGANWVIAVRFMEGLCEVHKLFKGGGKLFKRFNNQ